MGRGEETVHPGSDRQWWYCLRHSRPEHGPGCPNKVRMGPYPSQVEAERALHTAAERNEDWDEKDRED